MAAYAQVPRIREIDLQLRQSMALAAQAAFTRGGTQNTMEEIKNTNLALQEEKKQLIAQHFGAGWLDETPICPVCGGSGYLGSQMCSCLKALCLQEQQQELTLLSGAKERFDQFRLDYYPDRIDPKYGRSSRAVMTRTLEICRQYAENFSDLSGNLLFSGDTGLGKTFLSACIANTVAVKGYSVVYESAPHLFAKLEKARFHPDEEALRQAEKFSRCDLLIIDDLGTEMPGTFTTAALYALVNDRILGRKATVISTNLSTEELDGRYSPQIASRLRGEFRRVAFVGEDIRLIKNRG
jgi:DNA replication protein DnaC